MRSRRLDTRTCAGILAAVLLVATGPAAAGGRPLSYASIRVVRETPGEPSKPEITLPEGYELHTEGNYEVASRGEYYVFLKGPKGTARRALITWDVPIKAVIHGNTRLKLDRAGEQVYRCDIPVEAESLRAAWPSLEVHSHLNEKDLSVRIEHNHPDRAAGYYAERPWVAGPAQAALNFIFASREILRDWGVHHEIAEAGLGRIALMGFESNNPLHGDAPAHWHLIYYLPGNDGSKIPHFYMEDDGRVTSNRIDVLGRGVLRTANARDPMVCKDPQGRVRLAIDIRPDGGVDLGPEPGEWRYSIVAGEGKGGFTRSVRVLRRGQDWLRVSATNDVDEGVLTVRVERLDEPAERKTDRYFYDPLTGAPRRPVPAD
jgi:hypothetical protein